MGEIIRLLRNHAKEAGIGCMANLYQSVKTLDVKYFATPACQTMLLQPRNAAVVHWNRLKLNFDNGSSLKHYYCEKLRCTSKGYKLVSYYSNVQCHCGLPMDREVHLEVGEENDISDGEGVFVNGVTRFLVSDELQLMPASTKASLHFLSKLGVKDGIDGVEVREFKIGVTEVLHLLNYSMIHKTSLSETLLQHQNVPKSTVVNSDHVGSPVVPRNQKQNSEGDFKISLKLSISKSKQMVCYAEGGEDFVNLLFSFLTLPLGYTLKEMQGGVSSPGCIRNLYRSVQDINFNEKLKSEVKEFLTNPKVAMGFGYKNQLIGVEEFEPKYYNIRDHRQNDTLTTVSCGTSLSIRDPKSLRDEESGGFVKGSSMFTVSDNLSITPISPVSCLTILSTLKVPFDDIYEHTAFVNKEEASRLLIAAFSSDTVLTDVFVAEKLKDASIKEPKQETG